MDFGRISRSLVDIGGNLTLVEFSRIPGLVELGRFLGYIYVSGNFRLVGPSRFSRFRYGIYIVSYKALLPIAGGGKYKLKVILIDSYLI
jgi:hypothetical protein